MNEMELLQRLRAGLPAPRAQSRATARGLLMARIEDAGRTGRPWPIRFLPRRRRLTLAVAGPMLAAALVGLAIGVGGGDGRVQTAVGQVLRDTAEVAATRQPLVLKPGQFLFTRSKNAYLHANEAWSVLVPSVTETWASIDGTRKGRTRHVYGEPRFVSAGQRAEWVAAGSPPLPPAGGVEDSAVSGGGMVDAAELPTDPPVLRRMIEAREIPGVQGPPGEAETFTLIGDMLRQAYLPPDVRAALYRLTAELPGVELLGAVRDPVGRAGTGVAFTHSRRGVRQELIFDPETSVLLGERRSLLRSGTYGFAAPPGTPIGYAAYLESKVVDSVGRAAPAGAGNRDNSVGCYERDSLDGAAAVIHGADPIATCVELWREGVVGDRRGLDPPPLVACGDGRSTIASVFPGADPALCGRLGMVPYPTE